MRLEPVTLGLPVLHSASVLLVCYENKVKWVNIEQFVYFDDDCKLPLSKYKLRKKPQCSISNILMACPSGPTICEILAIS